MADFLGFYRFLSWPPSAMLGKRSYNRTVHNHVNVCCYR